MAFNNIFKYCLIIVFGCINLKLFAQNIALQQVFNGRYDFTFIGNTLNPDENSNMNTPTILTQSSANLNLAPNNVIEKAYLYWSGSGIGDYNIKLNGVNIGAQRIFGVVLPGTALPFFSAFADVTSQLQATGNGVYQVSDMDLSAIIADYFPSRMNYGGWAIVIVYSNPTLPINQLNVYDGLQAIPRTANSSLHIVLNSLNVVDNVGAKIGFLAWEGDSNIAVNETLKINGNTLSNPPLNPDDNTFNGTNSVTNSTNLYNMDLDIYDIQNNINVGDTTANIDLTSGQDFVMINAIVTKLNSQLPDASIIINNVAQTCNSSQITVNYTVYNTNGLVDLPTNTPVDFNVGYGIEDQIMQQIYPTIYTTTSVAAGGQQTFQVTFLLPAEVSDYYWLNFCVNVNPFTNQTYFPETNITNNCARLETRMLQIPKFNILPDLESCNKGLTSGYFDFSSYESSVKIDLLDNVAFFESEFDALNNQNNIMNIANYHATTTPKKIFVKLTNNITCTNITSFLLNTRKCEPVVFNAVSANNDAKNDVFFIEGLRNIFLDFELYIYNRWGQLVWKGNNNIEDFDGTSNSGFHVAGKTLAEGTYFYILDLKDINFPKTKNGYLYLTK